MKLVLDTSAYSHLRRGTQVAIDHLSGAELIYVPSVVLGELRAGFELGGRPRDNLAVLEEFLSEPFVETADVSPAVASHYGTLFSTLRRAGTPIPLNDVWIAATAIDLAAPLLTFDRDFDRIPNLHAIILEPG